MRLDEYVADGGLWGVINGLSPHPIPFVVDSTPDQLDSNLSFMFGERLILDKVQQHSKEYVARLIVSLFYEKWLTQIEALSGTIDITSKDIRIREEEGEETATGAKTSEVENKVSAYNETDLTTESGNSNTEENEGVRTQTRKVTEKLTDLSVIYRNLQTMQKLDIIQNATKDVANTISHRIY
jgi:hypothetical protein